MSDSLAQSSVPPNLLGNLFLSFEYSEFLEATPVLGIMEARIFHQRSKSSDREIESKLVIQNLQSRQQTKCLGISIKAKEVVVVGGFLTFSSEPCPDCHLALMPEWWVTEIMCQSHCCKERGDISLDLQFLVVSTEYFLFVAKRDAHTNASCQVADFERVRQSIPNRSILLQWKHLGFVRQTSGRGCEEDSIVVPFKLLPAHACIHGFRRAVKFLPAKRVQQTLPFKHR